MRVVITGGAGFIGANLCRQLADRNQYEIVVVDDLSTGSESNLSGIGRVTFERGSILSPDLLARAFAGADVIVHLAARPSVPRSLADPIATHDANATGTVYVLEAARKAKVDQVIVASSSSVYGANRTLPKSELLKPSPVSPYAASKLATETYALAWQHSFGIGCLAFRFFNVFGPLQSAGHAYAAVVPVFIDSALRGLPLPIHGDGHQTRDFTFVGSVVAVIADAIDRRVCDPEPVNLAFGSRHSLLDIVTLLEDVLNAPLKREFGETRLGDVRDSQADSDRLHQLFPSIRPVSLRDGLLQTVEWFRSVIT